MHVEPMPSCVNIWQFHSPHISGAARYSYDSCRRRLPRPSGFEERRGSGQRRGGYPAVSPYQSTSSNRKMQPSIIFIPYIQTAVISAWTSEKRRDPQWLMGPLRSAQTYLNTCTHLTSCSIQHIGQGIDPTEKSSLIGSFDSATTKQRADKIKKKRVRPVL